MKGQRNKRIQPVSRRKQKFATGLAGGHARARASLLSWYAARFANIWTSSRPEDRAAQIAALEQEQHAAVQALAREWAFKRQAAFAAAKSEVTVRRAVPPRPPQNNVRIHCRRPRPSN